MQLCEPTDLCKCKQSGSCSATSWTLIIFHSAMPNILELNCLVSGNDPCYMFTIEIASTENVSALKDAIKDKNEQLFQRVDARSLVLWNVSFPVDESLEDNLTNFADVKSLSPVGELSEVFSGLLHTHLHVVVGRPPSGACQ